VQPSEREWIERFLAHLKFERRMSSHTLAATAVLAVEEVVNQANNAKQVTITVTNPFTDAAVTALEKTPAQLGVLAEFGVVDAGGRGLVVLLDALAATLTGHTNYVNSVAFSPDGKTLASGSDDGTVRLWDVASRQPVGGPLTGHTGGVSSRLASQIWLRFRHIQHLATFDAVHQSCARRNLAGTLGRSAACQ